MTSVRRVSIRAMDLLRCAGEWLLSIALPRVCVGCGALAPRGSAICPDCRAAARGTDACSLIPEGVVSLVAGPALDGAVRRLVHGLKYDGHRRAARDLVELVGASDLERLPREAVLVPVPLTSARRRERGYNQAELLARELSRRTGIPVENRFLRRRSFRGSQTLRSGEQRREALGGMFAAGDRFDPRRIPILVDDVLTTGATLSSCAAICLHAGSPEVHGFCAAWASQA